MPKNEIFDYLKIGDCNEPKSFYQVLLEMIKEQNISLTSRFHFRM